MMEGENWKKIEDFHKIKREESQNYSEGEE